jgi:hypothetical protein
MLPGLHESFLKDWKSKFLSLANTLELSMLSAKESAQGNAASEWM